MWRALWQQIGKPKLYLDWRDVISTSTITVIVPIVAHAIINAHPSKFEFMENKIINHLPISIGQEGLHGHVWGGEGQVVDLCKNMK